MEETDDREELAKLFFSFANAAVTEEDWEQLKGTVAIQSYFRGADRILNSDWYNQKLLDTKIDALQLAAEALAGVVYETESNPKYRNMSHHDGLRHALDEVDVVAQNLKKDAQ